MVLAEAVKLDAGTVVIFLLVVLGVLLVVVSVVAWLGTTLGLALGRASLQRNRPGVSPDDLPRGSRAVLVVGAAVVTVMSGWIGWSVLRLVDADVTRSPVVGLVAALVLPVLWGFAWGRSRSFLPRNPPRRPDRPLGHRDPPSPPSPPDQQGPPGPPSPPVPPEAP